MTSRLAPITVVADAATAAKPRRGRPGRERTLRAFVSAILRGTSDLRTPHRLVLLRLVLELTDTQLRARKAVASIPWRQLAGEIDRSVTTTADVIRELARRGYIRRLATPDHLLAVDLGPLLMRMDQMAPAGWPLEYPGEADCPARATLGDVDKVDLRGS
jgi:hypothetical protein